MPVKLIDVRYDGYEGMRSHVDWYEALLRMSPDAPPQRLFLANRYRHSGGMRPVLETHFVRRRVVPCAQTELDVIRLPRYEALHSYGAPTSVDISSGSEEVTRVTPRTIIGIKTVAFYLVPGLNTHMIAYGPAAVKTSLDDWCEARAIEHSQLMAHRTCHTESELE